MKKYHSALLICALLSTSASRPAAHAGVPAGPNVVVIVADDAGYADWGFMDGMDGSNPTPTDIPTPNLDALANRGVKFQRAYVAQSCQPTRAALVTGGYQNRIGNEVVGNNYYQATDGFAPDGYPEGVPSATTTIWERMKSLGYSTAAVGKWHLGQIEDTPSVAGNRPEHQGVDEFFGIWHGSRSYNIGGLGGHPTQQLRHTVVDSMGNVTDTNVEAVHNGEYFTNTIGQFAVDYINDHHDDGNPFFLYQSFTAPHTPLQNSPDFNDPRIAGLSGDRKTYASMMLTMDKEIGRILDRLDDPDGNGDTGDSIADNTLVIFINDNGGADEQSSSPNGADNGVLRRGKGSPWEGGIRVPMIIAGAGVAPSAEGTIYDAPVHGVDVLPTAFAAGGGSLGPGDAGIDGVNLLPFINGTDASNPHDVLVSRHRTQFSVIKGDWKLVWAGTSPSANHQLYNIATDISETTNVAGANPALVAELQRDLTDHEAVWDKQRYEILSRTDEDTINIFNHFTFNPADPTPGEIAVVGGPPTSIPFTPTLANGNFEADSGSPLSFAEVTNWHDLDGNDAATNFGQTQGFAGSPEVNSQGAFIFGHMAANDAGRTVASAGEEFHIDFYANRFGNGYDGDEEIEVVLFTSATGVNSSTTLGDINILSTTSFPINSGWDNYAQDSIYTTVPGDVGETIYMALDLSNNTGGLVFPRIDVVQLTATTPGTGGSSVADWSTGNAWFEGGTTNAATMFNSDAFPGAVLEFPTADGFSYTSNNDMTRNTGLEFMMNKFILSGAFGGAQNESATIQGLPVLLTNDLNGVGPQIAVDATNAGAQDFSYNVDLDLVLYNDLTITGDGDVLVTVNGQIRDYFSPRGVTKDGTSTVVLAGNNTYDGDTSVEEGTLSITTAYLEDSSDVYLLTGAVFDLDFIGVDAIDSLFIDGVSQALGTWGAVGSGAENTSSLFTGAGLLLVQTVDALPGDFDGDGDVDGRDVLHWQRNDRSASGLADWQANYSATSPANSRASAVPEPTASAMVALLLGLGGMAVRSRTGTERGYAA